MPSGTSTTLSGGAIGLRLRRGADGLEERVGLRQVHHAVDHEVDAGAGDGHRDRCRRPRRAGSPRSAGAGVRRCPSPPGRARRRGSRARRRAAGPRPRRARSSAGSPADRCRWWRRRSRWSRSAPRRSRRCPWWHARSSATAAGSAPEATCTCQSTLTVAAERWVIVALELARNVPRLTSSATDRAMPAATPASRPRRWASRPRSHVPPALIAGPARPWPGRRRPWTTAAGSGRPRPCRGWRPAARPR